MLHTTAVAVGTTATVVLVGLATAFVVGTAGTVGTAGIVGTTATGVVDVVSGVTTPPTAAAPPHTRAGGRVTTASEPQGLG